MQGLKPYIIFQGNCKEAINYYKDKLDGEILVKSIYADSPMSVDEEHKNKILHSEVHFDGNMFMAADCMPGSDIHNGNNISMSVGSSDLGKIKKWFNNFSTEGKVIMPLEDQFWGATFGMLVDKFGITWMFNCPKEGLKNT